MRAAASLPDVHLSEIVEGRPDLLVQAMLTVHTRGHSFTEITRQVAQFVAKARARDGILLLFMRHTSASLVIQENADPDVQRDLLTALDRAAPEDAEWVHDVYSIPPAEAPLERDPVGPAEGNLHVVLGSGYLHGTVTELRLSYRDYSTKPRADVGFRVARALLVEP